MCRRNETAEVLDRGILYQTPLIQSMKNNTNPLSISPPVIHSWRQYTSQQLMIALAKLFVIRLAEPLYYILHKKNKEYRVKSIELILTRANINYIIKSSTNTMSSLLQGHPFGYIYSLYSLHLCVYITYNIVNFLTKGV